MGETRFTPGPWTASGHEPNFGGDCFVYGVDQRSVARVWAPLVDGEDLREPTARLIAAAPDLYEALNDAVRAIASLDSEALGVETIERNGELSVYWVRDELLSKARSALSRVSPQQDAAQAEGSPQAVAVEDVSR